MSLHNALILRNDISEIADREGYTDVLDRMLRATRNYQIAHGFESNGVLVAVDAIKYGNGVGIELMQKYHIFCEKAAENDDWQYEH